MIKKFRLLGMITSVIVFLFIINVVHSYPRIIANYSEDAFAGTGEESLMIESSIVEGAGYFLKSYKDMISFLERVEMSGNSTIDYNELAAIINRAIDNMSMAKDAYQNLTGKAGTAPYNDPVINRLITFDYPAFQAEKGLNAQVFAGVKNYLAKGDVRGIYSLLLARTGEILVNLNKVKASVETGNFPVIANLWRLNQLFSETLLFGQYTAEVFQII